MEVKLFEWQKYLEEHEQFLEQFLGGILTYHLMGCAILPRKLAAIIPQSLKKLRVIILQIYENLGHNSANYEALPEFLTFANYSAEQDPRFRKMPENYTHKYDKFLKMAPQQLARPYTLTYHDIHPARGVSITIETSNLVYTYRDHLLACDIW